jgi:hypothetical protein
LTGAAVIAAIVLCVGVNPSVAADDAPSIKVRSPKGGKMLIMGEKMKIRWTSTGTLGPSVRIELLRSNGLCTVIKEKTANDGRFSWTIPGHLESDNNYSVQIIALGSGNVRDRSRGYFAIVGEGFPVW